MARFTFKCPVDGLEIILDGFKKPNPPICRCGSTTQRTIKSVNTLFRGASANNNYYIPPTNSEIGLPTEYEMLRQSTKSADSYIDQADKDDKKDWDAEKKAHKEAVKKKVERVKEKNPQLYQRFKEAQERLKVKKMGKLKK